MPLTCSKKNQPNAETAAKQDTTTPMISSPPMPKGTNNSPVEVSNNNIPQPKVNFPPKTPNENPTTVSQSQPDAERTEDAAATPAAPPDMAQESARKEETEEPETTYAPEESRAKQETGAESTPDSASSSQLNTKFLPSVEKRSEENNSGKDETKETQQSETTAPEEPIMQETGNQSTVDSPNKRSSSASNNTAKEDVNPPAVESKSKLVKTSNFEPSSFDEIFGNQKTLEKLKAFGAFPNLASPIIFIGDDGCAKTTLARLFSMSVLGDKWQLWTYHSDGNCNGIGIDASSLDTKGERDKLENFLNGGSLSTPPTRVGFKICPVENIDGLPKQTVSEFSCLMDKHKGNILFVFTSKDRNKIPDSILKKCVEIPVAPLSNDEMQQMLKHLASKCDIEFSQIQLNEICRDAKGIPQVAVNGLIQEYTITKAQQMNSQNSQLNCNTGSEGKSDASKEGL